MKNEGPAGMERNGKIAAYVFSLLCTLFLAFQCVSYERKDRELPVTVWMPTLLLIGMGLGVQVDPKDLGGFLK